MLRAKGPMSWGNKTAEKGPRQLALKNRKSSRLFIPIFGSNTVSTSDYPSVLVATLISKI